MIGIAQGRKKLQAISAALKGNIINGVITDEMTAEQLLSR